MVRTRPGFTALCANPAQALRHLGLEGQGGEAGLGTSRFGLGSG